MYICLACLLMKCFLQVRYEGVRSRRKKGKLLDPETQEVRTQRVPADHTSCIINGLTPKTLYTFNITATFRDSMTGADQMVKTYTRLLGKLGTVCWTFFLLKTQSSFCQTQSSSCQNTILFLSKHNPVPVKHNSVPVKHNPVPVNTQFSSCKTQFSSCKTQFSSCKNTIRFLSKHNPVCVILFKTVHSTYSTKQKKIPCHLFGVQFKQVKRLSKYLCLALRCES